MRHRIPAITDVSAIEDGELVYLVVTGTFGEVADVYTCTLAGTNGDHFTVRRVGTTYDWLEFSTTLAGNSALVADTSNTYLSGNAFLVSSDDEGTQWVRQHTRLKEIARIRKEVAERALDVKINEPGSADAVVRSKRMLGLMQDLHRLETEAHVYIQSRPEEF